MKNARITNSLAKLCRNSLLLRISILLLVVSCDDGDNTSALKKLTNGTWTVKEVTIDNTNQTAMFSGCSITFKTDQTYTTTGGGVVWPAGGSWTYADKSEKKLIRNDGIEIDIVELTDTSLVLKLYWNAATWGGGRSKSIQGEHIFRMEH